MDRLTPERRSWLMSRVKSTDTGPELLVRKLIHGMGFRYRLHVKGLPGKPDIVLVRHRKIVLVHGCFWHRHANCRYATCPKTKRRFWNSKFESNTTRDSANLKSLRKMGWKTLVVWQCQTKQPARLEAKLRTFLTGG